MPISVVFPAKHPRAGEETYFPEAIFNALEYQAKGYIFALEEGMPFDKKLHTCRANYKLWKKRIDEVNLGLAVLELYCWLGKPYRSKTRVLFTFDKNSGIDVQELRFSQSSIYAPYVITYPSVYGYTVTEAYEDINILNLANNDGLSLEDFEDWFKEYSLTEPMTIIHFTKFRY